MPRIKEDSQSLATDLRSRLERLVAAARNEGREQALAEVRSLVTGSAPGRRGPGRPPKSARAPATPAAPKRKRRNPWAHMTPQQRADRVRKMLAGRGLKPKSER